MGYHVYPQEPATPSARSDTDLWNHINRWIWGKSGAESSPVGSWGAGESGAIVPTIQKLGLEHTGFHEKLASLGESSTKISDALAEHSRQPHGGGGLLSGIGSGLASTGVIILVVVGGYFYLTRKTAKRIVRGKK